MPLLKILQSVKIKSSNRGRMIVNNQKITSLLKPLYVYVSNPRDINKK